MQTPKIRPRHASFPDTNYRQGWTGYADDAGNNIGGGFGNTSNLCDRLIVFYAPNKPQAPSSTYWHRTGYQTIYEEPTGGWGWYAYWGHRWQQTPGQPGVDLFPFTGGDNPVIHCVQAVEHVDQVDPVFMGNPSFAPRATAPIDAVDTLTWGVPGYENLPSGNYLLIHVNACYFDSNKCYYVTFPTNPNMTRFFSYSPDAGSWGDPPVGNPPESMIQYGFAFNVDYAFIGGENGISFPAVTKSFGGPNIPNWNTTFQVLIRGRSPMGGLAAASMLGGPTPV